MCSVWCFLYFLGLYIHCSLCGLLDPLHNVYDTMGPAHDRNGGTRPLAVDRTPCSQHECYVQLRSTDGTFVYGRRAIDADGSAPKSIALKTLAEHAAFVGSRRRPETSWLPVGFRTVHVADAPVDRVRPLYTVGSGRDGGAVRVVSRWTLGPIDETN